MIGDHEYDAMCAGCGEPITLVWGKVSEQGGTVIYDFQTTHLCELLVIKVLENPEFNKYTNMHEVKA